MPYCKIAVNAPLFQLFTYEHPAPLPPGTRVAVPFRNKTVAGIVWDGDPAPDTDRRILPVSDVFDREPPLSEQWRGLIEFTARYYHHPIGQTAFAALPAGLRRPAPAALPPAEQYLTLTAEGRRQTPPRHSRQAALWTALADTVPLDSRHARRLHPQAAALLAKWTEQGWTETCPPPQIPPLPQPLNHHQQTAAQTVAAAQGYAPFLLHGITGSGKTETYFEMAAAALRQSRQVLFLLPEINLTPQFAARMRQRFADIPTVILNSRTAAGERTQGYLKARSGQAKLIIGTRLAIFTPLPELGLIVVDEEHDSSYKQDSELRYHARDLAVWRARQTGCPVVLGSATPSLESWHKAETGQYTLLTLPERARAAARLPDIRLIDTRRLPAGEALSPPALRLLADNHRQGGLSMVYLNRRGYSPALFCANCGHAFGCTACSAKMVFHKNTRRLACHHCGAQRPVPQRCPECGNRDLSAVGFGTQRLETVLREQLPEAAVVRIDRDSISRKNDWDTVRNQIDSGRCDILIGTQMLAKGHDFPRLNLIIVLDADNSLYSADFRAPEHLFAELMQVAGRAGRADTEGSVHIQTRLPDHPVYRRLLHQNYAEFARAQLAERRRDGLPPFTYTAAVRADAPDRETAAALLRGAAAWVAAQPQPAAPVIALGPVPMLLAKLAGRERMQTLLESPDRKALHHTVSLWQQAVAALKPPAACRFSIDIDPQEL